MRPIDRKEPTLAQNANTKPERPRKAVRVEQRVDLNPERTQHPSFLQSEMPQKDAQSQSQYLHADVKPRNEEQAQRIREAELRQKEAQLRAQEKALKEQAEWLALRQSEERMAHEIFSGSVEPDAQTSTAAKPEEPNIKMLGGVSFEAQEALFSQDRPRLQLKDPAPSKVSYRWQRLLLTPLFRAFLRTGVPILGLFVIGLYLLSNDQLKNDVTTRLSEARQSVQERPEFRIDLMHIEGASPNLAGIIRETAALRFPISTFELDLDSLRLRLEKLDGVKAARLQLSSGGVLNVKIDEREPVILWRNEKGLFILDMDGQRAGVATTRLDHKELPVVLGAGADQHVPEALGILQTAGPVENRVRGLMRIGERRWDLFLDRSQVIKLPEQNAVAALERILALHAVDQLLDRDITVFDFRDADRPVLRLSDQENARLRDVKSIKLHSEEAQ